MLSVHGEAIHQGDVPLLLIVNHNGVQFVGTFTHDYNEMCTIHFFEMLIMNDRRWHVNLLVYFINHANQRGP